MDAVVWTVIHHTGAGPARPTVWDTARYHAGPSPLKPPAICYHVYVEVDGAAYLCHDLETVTWAQGSGSPTTIQNVGSNNWRGLSICFAGERPTEAQITAINHVGAAVDEIMGRRLIRKGHQDVSVDALGRPLTECPDRRWSEWRHRVGA